MTLQECRKKLDEIDEQIVDLFEQRMQVSDEVARVKIASNRPVYDAVREQQKLDSVADRAHGAYNKTAIREIYTQIMTISRRYQYAMLAEQGMESDTGFCMVDSLNTEGVRVVYQGVEGAYAHQAALKFFGESQEVFHVPAFEEALRALLEGEAGYAVLPIENSTAGSVTDNYDLLITYPVYVVGETYLRVTHSLLGTMDAELSDIRAVTSHPQALAQCSDYLGRHDWRQIESENTAVAAKKVIEEADKTQAAVASAMAARLYGLKVLEEGIQNDRGNTTRFLVLSASPVYCRDADKISLSFELPHRYGSLYNLLGNFVFNHLNMLKIESRPIPEKAWEYRFFADIEGNLGDTEVKNALMSLKEEAQNLRILGNYIG